MEEQLIKFETAKLAKEKGFDIKTLNVWADFKLVPPKCREVSASELFQNEYYAPTQSLLQKWLRDVHNIEVEPCRIDLKGSNNYDCNVEIWKKNNTYSTEYSVHGKTYEEALEKGLQEALKLI